MKVRTHLWFNTEAEAALAFYKSVFKGARSLGGSQFPDGLSAYRLELPGLEVVALNTRTSRPFNEAVSLHVETEDQAETDYYWNALTAGGGKEQPCGWLIDRFGIYWQVTPKVLTRMIADPDKDKAGRALQAMYKMKKIIIADIERAYHG